MLSGKNKIDFVKYIGEFVVLTTNYTPNLKKLPTTISGLRIMRYKQKFVLARALTREDLLDEDFVDYLHNMWGTETDIDRYLRYARDETKID